MKKNKPSSFHPEFKAAMTALSRFSENQLFNDPAVVDPLLKAILHAPKHMKSDLYYLASQIGMLPEPTSITNDGKSVFTIEQLAHHFGCSVADLERGFTRPGRRFSSKTHGVAL